MTTPSADVISSDVAIDAADGVSRGTLLAPAGNGRHPGVLFLTDISGIRPAVLDRAARLAAHGYTVVVPNVFYRTGEPPFFSFPIDFANPVSRDRFNAMTSALTPEAIAHDAVAYVRFCHSQHAVQPGPLAIVGHCFTGAVALRMAGAEGAAVRFVASFHGGGLHTDKPNSPHFVLPKVSARLYFAHATDDRSMSAESIQQFEQELRTWGGEFESETYRAHHGWTMADHPAYHAALAERAFEALTSRLAELFPKAS
jgi:carboxymethylenebutenolidase